MAETCGMLRTEFRNLMSNYNSCQAVLIGSARNNEGLFWGSLLGACFHLIQICVTAADWSGHYQFGWEHWHV